MGDERGEAAGTGGTGGPGVQPEAAGNSGVPGDPGPSGDPRAPELRVGNAERDAAMTALGEHLRAGRLDPHEYDERVEAVGVARVRSELDRLFTDLPAPHPSYGASGPALTKATVTTSTPPAVADDGGPLFGRVGTTAVALTPFIALALFFGIPGNYWWWFLLIPVVGAIVYGGGRDRRHDRSGRDDRNR